jgi:hypothetical protein
MVGFEVCQNKSSDLSHEFYEFSRIPLIIGENLCNSWLKNWNDYLCVFYN